MFCSPPSPNLIQCAPQCSSNASAQLLVAPKTHPLTSLVPEKYSDFSTYSRFFCITNPPLLFCTAAHSLPHCLLSHPVVLLTSLIFPFWLLSSIFRVSPGIQFSSKLCICSSYLLQLHSPLPLRTCCCPAGTEASFQNHFCFFFSDFGSSYITMQTA